MKTTITRKEFLRLALTAAGGVSQFARKRSGERLACAAELGVGTNDLSQIELLEEIRS